jgi:hypothetical protein
VKHGRNSRRGMSRRRAPDAIAYTLLISSIKTNLFGFGGCFLCNGNDLHDDGQNGLYPDAGRGMVSGRGLFRAWVVALDMGKDLIRDWGLGFGVQIVPDIKFQCHPCASVNHV